MKVGGDEGRGLPQCYKHKSSQQHEQWSSEWNKTSPDLNQTLSHDNSQLYSAVLDTLCIQTVKINTSLGERDSQKQQSPKTEINKELRLVKQVLLLAAGRALCVCVRACVYVCQPSAGHISAVGESVGREDSYFCLKCIHCTTAEAKTPVPSISLRSELKRSFLCVCLTFSVYLSKRGSVCMTAYWVIYGDDLVLAKKDKSGERGNIIMDISLQHLFL